MASRSGAGPSPPGQGLGRYVASPRRQVAVRLSTSVPANGTPTELRKTSGGTYTSAAMLAAVQADDISPKIAEIQSRVEALVRRYDDAVAAADHDELEDEDDSFGDKRTRTPARWRVGDVLLSTHRSLARTSTHTERSIVADFGDDPEVNAAMGNGAQKVGNAFTEAEDRATRRHQRLSHIHQALQSVAANGMALDDSDEEDTKPPPYAVREHQLKSTIDALHREKDSLVTQLQEALRIQQESRVEAEQQAQDLSKAHRALRTQSEELRLALDHNEAVAESANTQIATWRDKFQASAKAATAAEAKVQELEVKVRAQSEEIMKHTFVLQAKTQEMERFKENEAARSRAEAAAQAAALAGAEAEARRAKAKALKEKRKTKVSVDDSNKDHQEMEDKIRELEGTLLAMEIAKRQLETENEDLLRRLRELQARFGEQRKSRLFSKENDNEATPAQAATFALRLRENAPNDSGTKRLRGGIVVKVTSNPVPAAVVVAKNDGDDLSSSESEAEDRENEEEEEEEVERDERELNEAMQRVVAEVFPLLSPIESDETLDVDESIAQYEDPSRSPMNAIQPSPAASVVLNGGMASSSNVDAVPHSDVNVVPHPELDVVPRSELDTLRNMYDNEVEALKQQYVDGLQEYKRLVLEQYGRRQAIEHERHRLEIEGLLRLIQSKFHAEQARRSDRLQRTKASLKVLYNSLRQHSGPTMGPKEGLTRPFNSTTPLKTLLRAAILAMSTSAKRNGRGRTQIEAIHEQLTKLFPSPDTRTTAVAAAMTIHTVIQEDKPRIPVATRDVWCQTDPILTLIRERRVEAAQENQHVAPKSLDGYILPGSQCFPSPSKPKQQQDLVMLHLVVGIPISATLISELRRLLPNLPRGNYYVSNALRLALFHELVRFYAAVEMQVEANKTRPSPRLFEGEDQIQDAEVVIGSPRDTPFLRRKALETIESKARQRNRRHLFASGGAAIAAFTSTSTSSSLFH
ncbi:hypothetical protein PI124_g11138 [Phytophthora idaei]|nr:hypothetical protein PI125_g10644 [Phytophthora idaei]KAG3154992.1 hypothetical protein PI126_g9371 [Phytophthora idaei]KAG3244063.1 hypothetical protein PI124_g11138 [Phytophthora idaei]